jgi:hypothetical protein
MNHERLRLDHHRKIVLTYSYHNMHNIIILLFMGRGKLQMYFQRMFFPIKILGSYVNLFFPCTWYYLHYRIIFVHDIQRKLQKNHTKIYHNINKIPKLCSNLIFLWETFILLIVIVYPFAQWQCYKGLQVWVLSRIFSLDSLQPVKLNSLRLFLFYFYIFTLPPSFVCLFVRTNSA